METLIDFLAEARDAYRRNDWRASYAAFVRADGIGSIPPDDLHAYAAAAWRLGYGREAVRLAERAYDRSVRADPPAAAMTAAVLAMQWHARGHDAVSRQWADRAHALAAGGAARRVDGYLAYLDAATALAAGDAAGLSRALTALQHTASETGDATLALLARVVGGVAALDARAADGYRMLDDALLPVLDDRIPLDWAGDVYRLVLRSGRRADAQHRRAWTESMQRWVVLTGVVVDAVV
ncbi:hypothetical protein [Mycobacterium sp. 1274761.0]|uniref:hypothetical protein n=1 Tax=Mycobacterium sp. 1274761.0 TaxID=1834077 RepID=UPI0007FDAF9C|nr:hypothetical protein [Mycobacterium sp. 1274761.0]OBK72935.1 hypothetical protein A5651_14465 [Mycobacterium sp. 1274761.0]